jgi:phospholipid/cholesterol/gamma-HCH transport system permease protein
MHGLPTESGHDQSHIDQTPESRLPRLSMEHCPNNGLQVTLSGNWTLGFELPSNDDVLLKVQAMSPLGLVIFDTTHVYAWDTRLIVFLGKIVDRCREKSVNVSLDDVPPGMQKLIELFRGSKSEGDASWKSDRESFLFSVGDKTEALWSQLVSSLTFLGDLLIAFARMVKGSARFKSFDLLAVVQDAGVNALPIVFLISILVGLILAFVGSVQLRLFGAQIYIADLVGVATVRAMGAIMTGIIMAGRTGASYAAGIGTMEVNEEIDALKTAGISPFKFLVVPRILGLTIMMPLLTIYADLAGILGGFLVGVFGFGLSPREYYNETLHSLSATNVAIGLISSVIFGLIIGFMGCLKGMKCGRSASAVGEVTTSAVVASIIGIIIATALITVVCNILGV